MPFHNSEISKVKLQTLTIINFTNFLLNISLSWQMLADSVVCIIKYTEAVMLLHKCHLSFRFGILVSDYYSFCSVSSA